MGEIDRAIALEPLALTPHAMAALLNLFTGHADRAVEIARSVVERNPKHFLAQWELVMSYRNTGQYAEATAAFDAAVILFGRHPWLLGEIGVLHARTGNTRKAEALQKEILQMAKTRFVSPYFLSLIPMELGRTDEALTFLEQMVEVRDGFALWLSANTTALAPGRDHPRFRNMRRQVGLE